jgi:hypothetical protein
MVSHTISGSVTWAKFKLIASAKSEPAAITKTRIKQEITTFILVRRNLARLSPSD